MTIDHRLVRSLAAAALLVAPSLLPGATAGAEENKRSPLEMTRKLIEESSGAKRIAESGVAEAQAQREQARQLLKQAQDAEAAGKKQQAAELIKQARTTMFDAVRLAGPDASILAKHERDFTNRLDSVEALLEAHDRVSTEKGAPAKGDELHRLVVRKVDEAKGLRDQGQVKQGRAVLDEAYVAAKVAIESLRGGDTLVRSLNFASKEEEFAYEIDRNDTHKMLVAVLLKEKMTASSGVNKMVNQFMGKAEKVRNDAEHTASGGDYNKAVEMMEESTKQIQRAIRSAGIYIPG